MEYLKFCLEWWNKGGVVNFIILGGSFFIGFFYFNKNYSKYFVNIIISSIPLLGLLGTVVGMIQTFNALQNTGTDVQSLAGGISKAMITTSSGICVAILGTIFLPLKKDHKANDFKVDNSSVKKPISSILQIFLKFKQNIFQSKVKKENADLTLVHDYRDDALVFSSASDKPE